MRLIPSALVPFDLNLVLLTVVIVGPVILLGLLRVLNKMLDHQIEEQMQRMIPLKSLRRKVGVRIKWR